MREQTRRHGPAVDSFETSHGRARFADGALVLEESALGRVRSLFESYWRDGSSLQRGILVTTVLSALYGTGTVAWQVQSGTVQGSYVRPVLAVVVTSIGALKLVDYARGFRSPDRIPLGTIDAVSAARGRKGLTRPRLVVRYRQGGNSYRCRVNLQSLYTPDGPDQFERSVRAFEQRGIAVH
jgi:hypothetical protein